MKTTGHTQAYVSFRTCWIKSNWDVKMLLKLRLGLVNKDHSNSLFVGSLYSNSVGKGPCVCVCVCVLTRQCTMQMFLWSCLSHWCMFLHILYKFFSVGARLGCQPHSETCTHDTVLSSKACTALLQFFYFNGWIFLHYNGCNKCQIKKHV